MKLILILLSTALLTWILSYRQQTIGTIFHGPKHSEYQQALDSALVSKTPVLLHFTADNCPNPVKMQEFFEDPITRDLLKNFIYLELSVTDGTILEKDEIYPNELGASVKTRGARNADLEISVFHENVQPYLVIVNGLEEIISTSKFVATSEELRKFLLSGVRK